MLLPPGPDPTRPDSSRCRPAQPLAAPSLRISPALEIRMVDAFGGTDRLIAVAEAILVERVRIGIVVEG